MTQADDNPPKRNRPDRTAGYRPQQNPGLAVRRIAAEVVDGVIRHARPFDATLEGEDAHAVLKYLNGRDRALATMLCQTTLRQLGFLRAILTRRLDKPLPRRAGRTEAIVLVGMAQILFLDIPAHAAVDLAVRDAAGDRDGRHFRGLVNAVLRAVAADPQAAGEGLDPRTLNTPDWLAARWAQSYGPQTAAEIMAAHMCAPALDLSVRADPEAWARRLEGVVLANGSVRLSGPRGAVARLEGFREGGWWVQDAAAALPVRLLGDVAGLHVADLAAAPGGKTAQLAAAGAQVVAVDRSKARMERLEKNLSRLALKAQTAVADIAKWQPDAAFDAVLLDAPCSATGTIRRHPDIPWLRRDGDFAAMGARQAKLIARAAQMLKPGGRMVYATCSLEREEGEEAVAAAIGAGAPLSIDPVKPAEAAGFGEVTGEGFLRTRPDMAAPAMTGETLPGMDGFFIARLIRS